MPKGDVFGENPTIATTNTSVQPKGILYWVLTGLLCFVLIAGGATEILEVPPQVASMKAIGYPIYLLPFLGVAKILGVAAILYGKQLKLKEWAYAGVFFDLLGATYSHLMSANIKEAIPPLVLTVICLVSYTLWQKQLVVGRAAEPQVNFPGVAS